MKIDFEGLTSNALDQISSAEAISGDDIYWVDLGHAKTCISAFHDTILGLCNGTFALEEVKEFWFSGKDINSIKLMGDIIRPDHED